jgi:hypothetical protein
VKQEGGRAALMCLLSQSTLEREFWLGELPEAGFATDVRRGASRQVKSPGHMRTGLTRRDSTAVGLSGTALRLDVHETTRGAGSAASSSRMHPAAVSFQPGSSAQKNVQAARKSRPPGLLQNCGRPPLWLFRRSKSPITALGVSPYDNVRHASPVSAQLAADHCFLRYGKAPMFRSPNLIPAQYLLDTCLIPGVESGSQPNKNPAFINSRR